MEESKLRVSEFLEPTSNGIAVTSETIMSRWDYEISLYYEWNYFIIYLLDT